MSKLLKLLVVLVILVGGIKLVLRCSSDRGGAGAGKPPAAGKNEVPQVQEKYGFAPVGQD